MANRRRALSLSRIVRTRAIHRGILGSSPLWRAIAIAMFGRRLLKRLVGKNAENLGTETLRAGQMVQIEAIDPAGPRGRRASRRRRA